MNKFNLMDEVFYLDFHRCGVEICPGVVTGMRVANVVDDRGHLKKNRDTITEYLINQTFGKYEENGQSYDLGDQAADKVFFNKVFATYEQAFEYLNNYVQGKKR